jgi:hypothetical protein
MVESDALKEARRRYRAARNLIEALDEAGLAGVEAPKKVNFETLSQDLEENMPTHIVIEVDATWHDHDQIEVKVKLNNIDELTMEEVAVAVGIPREKLSAPIQVVQLQPETEILLTFCVGIPSDKNIWNSNINVQVMSVFEVYELVTCKTPNSRPSKQTQ